MKRRDFVGCATGLSLLSCQQVLGQQDGEEQRGLQPPAERATVGLKMSHPTVDIALVCSDFKESLRFYHDQLGLEIVQDLQIPGDVAKKAGLAPRGFRQVRLRAGSTLIKLMDIAAPPPNRSVEFAAGVRWLTFFVQDVRQTFEQLKARGVQFLSDPVAAPDAAGVVCAVDPDGVLIELVQK